MKFQVSQTQIHLVEGDIADQDTEAVVTAAHWDLKGGQGTDGSIHYKAGPELLEFCKTIGGCPIGDAVITPAFQLKANFVIHAVGPVYEGLDGNEAALLRLTYQNSLKRAVEQGIVSISFPSISTGAFCYPMKLAAPIAAKAIVDFLKNEEHPLNLVRMVLYPKEQKAALKVYEAAFRKILD